MSKLVIPGLKSEENVKFYLTGEFYGENPSSVAFNINVPKACPLIYKTNIGLKVRNLTDEYVTNDATVFSFTSYSKLTISKKNAYKIRFRVNKSKERGTLKVGDTVLVNSSGPLASLNGKVFKIIASVPSSNNDAFVVDIEVDSSISITQARGSVTGSFTENYALRKFKEFEITLSTSIFNNLINIRNPIKGTLISQVIDVPIYAYKNFEGENSTKEPRLLLFDNKIVINENTPPIFNNNFVNAYLAGNSYKNRLRSDQKRNFLFYVAIARYRYANNQWRGRWLQVNKEDKAIWGKAVS